MTRRGGFTLIELLLAVALLTMLATAAVSWAVSQRRSGALIEARYERLQQILSCQQAVQEDLLAALTPTPIRPDEAGRLAVTTLRHLPDESPGRREVLWSFDGDRQALVRTSRDANGELRRLALVELTTAQFVDDERRGLLLVVQPSGGGQPVSVALWSGR